MHHQRHKTNKDVKLSKLGAPALALQLFTPIWGMLTCSTATGKVRKVQHVSSGHHKLMIPHVDL